jgi:hypothetical protein
MTTHADVPLSSVPPPASAQTASPSSASAQNVSAQDRGRDIIGPRADFLLLGGASLVVVPLTMMMPATAVPGMILLMWMLSDVINQPHFAASYQIFYRNFRDKILGETLPREMRIRYMIAGIGAPILMVAFFTGTFLAGSALMLGWAGNAMLFLVGWHYNKQG